MPQPKGDSQVSEKHSFLSLGSLSSMLLRGIVRSSREPKQREVLSRSATNEKPTECSFENLQRDEQRTCAARNTPANSVIPMVMRTQSARIFSHSGSTEQPRVVHEQDLSHAVGEMRILTTLPSSDTVCTGAPSIHEGDSKVDTSSIPLLPKETTRVCNRIT